MDHKQSGLSAADIIRLLDLAPHPEGGHFRETFRDVTTDAVGRSASTAIYFLLSAGEVSRWHRIDAAETWHWYAGAPLELNIAGVTGRRSLRLGVDLAAGERPAGGGAGRRLAAGRKSWRLDSRRLHGGTRLSLRGFRACPGRLRTLVTARAGSRPVSRIRLRQRVSAAFLTSVQRVMFRPLSPEAGANL